MIRGFLHGTESWGSVSTAHERPTSLSQPKDANVLNDQVGSVPVAVFHAVATDTITVFCLRLSNRTSTFDVPKSGATDVVVDSETGSQMGPLRGVHRREVEGPALRAIVPEPSFWFSWAGFYPNTEIHAASTGQPRRIGGLKLDR